jgi:cell division protein FtsW
MYIAMIIDCSFYQKHLYLILIATVLSLALVLIFGHTEGGGRRWIRFGLFAIQPAEFAKLTMIIFVSDFIAGNQKRKVEISKFLQKFIFSFFCLVGGLIIFENDLGTIILIFIVCAAMLIHSGIIKFAIKNLVSLFKIFVITALSIAILFYTTIWMLSYRKGRIEAFVGLLSNIFNIEYIFADKSRYIYQIKQSISAIGSGGIFGKGLGGGDISSLGFLSQASNDFAFASIGEQFGFVGSIIFISIYMLLFFKMNKLSKKIPSLFSKYLCLGITYAIVFQALLNMFVTAGIAPTKGITLPFVSYGGSSLLMCMISAGILINLSQYETNSGNKKWRR